VAVNAAFGSGSVEDRAVLEVVAAPTVTRAFDDLAANWPAEIETEAALALDGSFGPFDRRLGVALDALTQVGATDDQLARLDEAWVDTLAARDPESADVYVDLDDDLRALVLAATPVHVTAVGAWADDTSLVTDVATPATDAYLASTCPDRGVLSGQEVDG
jgi:hypothetical protein